MTACRDQFPDLAAAANCSSFWGSTTVAKWTRSSFSFCFTVCVRPSSMYSCFCLSYWGQLSRSGPLGELRRWSQQRNIILHTRFCLKQLHLVAMCCQLSLLYYSVVFSQPDLELVSVLGSIIFQSSSFSNQSTTTKTSIEVKGTTGLGDCPFKRPLSVFCCQPSGVLSMALSIAFAIVGACSDARGLIYIKKRLVQLWCCCSPCLLTQYEQNWPSTPSWSYKVFRPPS